VRQGAAATGELLEVTGGGLVLVGIGVEDRVEG